MSTFDIDFVFDDEAAETAGQESGFGVLDTGVYEVIINHASLDKTQNGNNTLSLSVATKDGHSTTLWNVFGTIDKTWKSGKENFNYGSFQAFMGVAGVKSITPVPFELELDNGQKKQLTVVKELHGKKMKLAIQKVLDIYKGEVKESNEIHSSYNEKGQNYAETKAGSSAEKIDKVAERLKDKQTKRYKQAMAGGIDNEHEKEEESTDSLL